MRLAFQRRKDLLSLQAQLEVATQARKAVRAERLPTLAFDGYYGVLGQIGGLYHGVFSSATGKVSVPVFQEGQLRGESEVATAQAIALRQQIESLRVSIEWQIRAAMLDVQSSNELVKVARSNVDLATLEVQDASDRFKAGVDDNLPVVQAQAVLAAGAEPAGADTVSVQPIEADAGAKYGCGGDAVQGLSGAVGAESVICNRSGHFCSVLGCGHEKAGPNIAYAAGLLGLDWRPVDCDCVCADVDLRPARRRQALEWKVDMVGSICPRYGHYLYGRKAAAGRDLDR